MTARVAIAGTATGLGSALRGPLGAALSRAGMELTGWVSGHEPWRLGAAPRGVDRVIDLGEGTPEHASFVCRMARRGGARRLVRLSSWKVYGTPRACPIVENEPLTPVGPSGWRHAEAERAARHHADAGLEVTVLRPAPSLLPRPPAALTAVFAALSRGLPLPLPGGARCLLQLTGVGDLVAGLVAAASGPPRDPFRVYNIGSRVCVPFCDALRSVATRTGVVARVMMAPRELADGLARLTRLGLGPVSPEIAAVLTTHTELDTARASAELGFEPRGTTADALLEAYLSWRAGGRP